MPLCCAVYGYECTRVAPIGSLELRPRFPNHIEAEDRARDKSVYQLTAVIVGDQLDAKFAFRLEAILSFIEHLDVIVTDPVVVETSNLFQGFPSTLPTHGRHDGGGATLMSDVFGGNSRAQFIRNCLEHLADDQFCDRTKFRDLLFKKVETFRQRRPFLEISYFLLYSGLEAHARAVTGDLTNKNSSEPIARVLTSYGFDVSVERPTDLARAISTYTHIRNSLFHNAQLEATVNMNGSYVVLKLLDYYVNLLSLVSLVILKSVSFDDGHINWNGWIDHQPFK